MGVGRARGASAGARPDRVDHRVHREVISWERTRDVRPRALTRVSAACLEGTGLACSSSDPFALRRENPTWPNPAQQTAKPSFPGWLDAQSSAKTWIKTQSDWWKVQGKFRESRLVARFVSRPNRACFQMVNRGRNLTDSLTGVTINFYGASQFAFHLVTRRCGGAVSAPPRTLPTSTHTHRIPAQR